MEKQGDLFDDGKVHDANFNANEYHRDRLRQEALKSKKKKKRGILNWFDEEEDDDFSAGFQKRDSFEERGGYNDRSYSQNGYGSYGSTYSSGYNFRNSKFGSYWVEKNNEDSIIRPHISAGTEKDICRRIFNYIHDEHRTSDWNLHNRYLDRHHSDNDRKIKGESLGVILENYQKYSSEIISTYQSKGNEKQAAYSVKCMKAFYVLHTELVTRKEFDMMLIDLFKNFNCRDLKFDIKNDQYWWFDIMSANDNYMIKMISNESFLHSFIIAKHLMINMLANIFDFENKQDPNSGSGNGLGNPDPNAKSWNKQQGSGKGQGNPDPNGQGGDDADGEGDPSDQSGNGQGSGSGKSPFSKEMTKDKKDAFDNAMNEIQEKEKQADMLGENLASITDPKKLEELENMTKQMGNVKVSKKLIEKFVKKSIKNMQSSVRGSEYQTQENFFDCDDMIDIPEAHLLNTMELIEDMDVMVSNYSMKFDIYIDISGSMSSMIQLGKGDDGKPQSMQRISLAKILAYKMKKMNILNQCYTFNTSVRKIDREKIFAIGSGGGTCIDTVINHIAGTNIPSMILSDGDDHIQEFNPKAYIMTICSNIQGPAVTEFAKRNQMVFYDNEKFKYARLIGNQVKYME